MVYKEADLKNQLKNEPLKRLYVLYGEESYLTAFYANKIAALAVSEDEADFNLDRLDGTALSADEIIAAAETLPAFAEHRAVVVCDYNAATDQTSDAFEEFFADLPESTVLVFWYCSIVPDGKARWKKFLTAAGKDGFVTEFPHPSVNEAARLLCGGAKKRGCALSDKVAEQLATRCGTDLHTLLNELDKLCACAGQGGTITAEMVTALTHETLEARVFDLSKTIWQGNASRAFTILHTLKADKEKPTGVLAVLSSAYADLYRVKVASAAGERPESLTRDFAYGKREFVLRNAARDGGRMGLATLRGCIALLAKADTGMKSSSMDNWWILERTVSELLAKARG